MSRYAKTSLTPIKNVGMFTIKCGIKWRSKEARITNGAPKCSVVCTIARFLACKIENEAETEKARLEFIMKIER